MPLCHLSVKSLRRHASPKHQSPKKRQPNWRTISWPNWVLPPPSMKGMSAPPSDPLTATPPMRVGTVLSLRPQTMKMRLKPAQQHSDPQLGPRVATEESVSAAAAQHLHNCGRGASSSTTMPSPHAQQPHPRRQTLNK